MVRWHLVRHGRTINNRDNRVQGHSQIPLDEEGMIQTRNLRDRLANEVFAAAFSRDLMRTQQTARIILDSRQITLVTSPDLRELDYGLWEGLSFEEIKSKYADDLSRFMEGDHDFAPPEGESVSQLLERTARFVEQVEGHVKEGIILVVCHGGSLRGLVVQLMGLKEDSFWNFQVDLTSLSIVDVYPNRSVLTLFNDTSHLRDVGL